MTFSRRFAPVGVAAILAVSVVPAAPAAAAVRYDPVARSGFADAADVRAAFGWSEATLSRRAGRLTFGHQFFTRDTYAVWCGTGPFPVAHERDYGRYELTGVAVREPRRGAPTGYAGQGRLTGFRISGPHAGISGTSVAPAAGQPCPTSRGPRITRADLVSTTTGWSLAVRFSATERVLRSGV